MEEKQQKKIKASPRPGKLAGYLTNFLASVGLAGMSTNRYQEKLPYLGRGQREVKQAPVWAPAICVTVNRRLFRPLQFM